MIKELQAIAGALKESRAQLWRSIAGLTLEQSRIPFPRGEWSIHDALAHLAANEGLMTGLAHSIATGEQGTLLADFDNDRFNAESVTARRGKTMDDLFDELGESRARLFDVLEAVTPDQLEHRGTHPLQGDLTLKELLVVMHAHETTHAREIAEHARRVMAKS